MNFAANCIPLSQLDVRELTRPSSALEGLARETMKISGLCTMNDAILDSVPPPTSPARTRVMIVVCSLASQGEERVWSHSHSEVVQRYSGKISGLSE